MQLHEELNKAVRRQGSLWAFSRRADIEPSFLSKMLNGKLPISLKNLAKIQEGLLKKK